ncbi:P-loop ATPase, Sll1717 family [Ferrimonas marina]|uniref:Uncharacterized protein n=1 Tax=Ferrimonas marina TaxID=299255 RepID=A0A1M5S0S5_9GAMM|nr:hypothetical protein [Ferrimonas marina]SHH31928.1 hypothetical protein SAMN02745129_1823 [Ferrimonas marina]
MNNLRSLSNLFFGDSAEKEARIRNEVFVEPRQFKKLLKFPRSNHKIIVGDKGCGKSMLLNVINESVLDSNTLSMLITPHNIVCDPIGEQSTISDKQSVAYDLLLELAVKEIDRICNTSETNIINNEQNKEVKAARFRAFLEEKGNVSDYFNDHSEGISFKRNNRSRLANKLKNMLVEKDDNIWIMIDDVDTASILKSTSNSYDYSVCWAIISAAIKLSNDFFKIRVLISVRTDIWHIMEKNKFLGRDIRDKITNPFRLNFTEEEIEAIFLVRLNRAALDLDPSYIIGEGRVPYRQFFADSNYNLPGKKGSKKYWSKWIAQQSRNKPRDMVQLVQNLIESAEDEAEKNGVNGEALINDECANKVILDFAKSRIDNLETEFQEICPQIGYLVKDVSKHMCILRKQYRGQGRDYSFSYQEIIEYLSKYPSRRKITIDKISMSSGKNTDAIKLLGLLYMSNFINARKLVDSGKSDLYTHETYNEYPDLISEDKINDLQSYRWEIHPVFRSYLDSIKDDLTA